MDYVVSIHDYLATRPELDWYWNWNYSAGSGWVVVIGCVLYVATIFSLKAYMSSREAWKHPLFVRIMGLHNLLLSVWSAAMFAGVTGHGIVYFYKYNFDLYEIMCDPYRHYTRGPFVFWLFIFYLSKYYEFLDTIFLLLRKSPLIFLHWYHHILTLSICWAGVQYRVHFAWMAMANNTAVHVLMYFYYFLTTIGQKDVWWKRYLTQMQMIQFCLNGAGVCLWIFWHNTSSIGCNGDNHTVFWVFFANVTFLFLFYQHYRRSYAESGKKKSARGKPAMANEKKMEGTPNRNKAKAQ